MHNSAYFSMVEHYFDLALESLSSQLYCNLYTNPWGGLNSHWCALAYKNPAYRRPLTLSKYADNSTNTTGIYQCTVAVDFSPALT